VAGNAAAGSGVGPGLLHYVLGITKAYCTRVGGGPFPTELDWKRPAPSATTCPPSAPRWASPPGGAPLRLVRRRAAQAQRPGQRPVGPVHHQAGRAGRPEELKLCTGYELDGEHIDLLPLGADEIERCKPIYETMEGWSESTVGATDYDKLPVAARLYLQRIEHVTGVPIHLVSTSPDREHTILMRHPSWPIEIQIGLWPALHLPTSYQSRSYRMLTEDGKHLYVSYDEYHDLIEKLAIKVHQSGWRFDTILCLARGGMRPGDMLAHLRRAAGHHVHQLVPRRGRHGAGPPGHRPLHHHAAGPDRRQGAAGRRPGRHRRDAERGGRAPAHQLPAHHRAAHRRPLDQGHVQLPGRLLGGAPAHQPWIHQPFEGYDGMSPERLLAKWKV
jgi:hypothetical protein